MRITLTGVFVGDQDKALQFYTETLGFVKKNDVPVGEFKWLTVVSPDDPDGTELLLEPNENPVAQNFRKGYLTRASQRRPLALWTSVQSMRN